jgi:hypothetical protein
MADEVRLYRIPHVLPSRIGQLLASVQVRFAATTPKQTQRMIAKPEVKRPLARLPSGYSAYSDKARAIRRIHPSARFDNGHLDTS